MRIGFLISGANAHHVAHALPIARALVQAHPAWNIYLVTTGRSAGEEAARLLTGMDGEPTHLRVVPRNPVAREADPRAVMHEEDVLPSLDAVLVTSLDHAAVVDRGRAAGQRIVYLWAGAKDHADLQAGWDRFDGILVAGDKTKAGLVEQAGVLPDGIAVVGCAKLDQPLPEPARPLTPAGRKVVLYNPHHAPEFSSWYRWGRSILEWFAAHDDYHLILAPHIKLFGRSLAWSKGRLLPRRVGHLDARYFDLPNIHIDLGSALSTTRAYTECADLYLGDAGGQLYEFLSRPRPCGFLNANGLRHGSSDPQLFNWRAGHVIEHIDLLGDVLATTQLWHEDVYRPIQQEMFSWSISTTDTPASQRAADAIATVLTR